MSYVNNVILTFSIGEDVLDRIGDVNNFLARYNQGVLPGVWDRQPDWYGGDKALEQPVFIAAFKYVSAETIVEAVKEVEWREPESVRVFFCEANDDAFGQIWPVKGE